MKYINDKDKSLFKLGSSVIIGMINNERVVHLCSETMGISVRNTILGENFAKYPYWKPLHAFRVKIINNN